MKTNTFEQELDNIAATYCDSFVNQDDFKDAIRGLVLNDVIGEDEQSFPTSSPLTNLQRDRVHAFNYLRSEQRAIIKGGNHED